MSEKIFLSLLLFFAGVTAANSQEELSLADAIQIGLANNYDIRIVNDNVEIAENLNNQGQAGRWPSLQLNLAQNNNANDQIKTASPFQPKGVIINNNISPALQLNWTLFEGFKVNISKNRYEKLQQESEGNAMIAVSNTVQAIVLGYYLVVLEAERLEVFRRSLKLSRDRYEYVRLKKDYGSAITSDLLLEEGHYLSDSLNYINQQQAFRSSLRTLNNLLAVDDLDKEYKLTDGIEVPIEKYDLRALEKRMLENNLDLKTKYISQSVIKHDLELSRSERYPKLMLNANTANSWGRVDQSRALYYNISTEEYSSPPLANQVLSTYNISYAVNFSLTYNLFNGRKINTAIRNALMREDIGNTEIDKMKLELRKDLYDTYDNLNRRLEVFGINSRKLEVAELNLRISEDKYKLGAINSFDFRTVQLIYLTSALQALNSRYDLVESKISLMRLTGTILEEYR